MLSLLVYQLLAHMKKVQNEWVSFHQDGIKQCAIFCQIPYDKWKEKRLSYRKMMKVIQLLFDLHVIYDQR